jgi:hypothetical protein
MNAQLEQLRLELSEINASMKQLVEILSSKTKIPLNAARRYGYSEEFEEDWPKLKVPIMSRNNKKEAGKTHKMLMKTFTREQILSFWQWYVCSTDEQYLGGFHKQADEDKIQDHLKDHDPTIHADRTASYLKAREDARGR